MKKRMIYTFLSVMVIVAMSRSIADWHSVPFGGTVTVLENPTWSNWSSYWKIGQTSIYDIATPLDMKVNYLDASDLTGHYGESGDAGWIYADIDDNGNVNYLDASSLTSHYGDDYTT